MRLKTQKAFTFVELLISMVIIGLLGGAALMVMWFSVVSYSQMDDYTSAESEMEYAAQRLSRNFALIALGMPNNRKGKGSFASTFATSDTSSPPIMAFFGSSTDIWGGPVTVAAATPASGTITNPGLLTDARFGPGGAAYVGPELYYAWAVPTGVKARFKTPDDTAEVKRDDEVDIETFYTPDGTSGKDYLEKFSYDGINGKFSTSPANSVRNWLLFPTLRLPLRVDAWSGSELKTTVAPDSALPVRGTLMGLDEIHLIQAARLYLNNHHELVRVVFDTESSTQSEVLAHNVVGLHFVYNPTSRLLTMYMAARGMEIDGAGNSRAQPTTWPSWLPGTDIASSDLRYRIVTKNLTWRIRN